MKTLFLTLTLLLVAGAAFAQDDRRTDPIPQYYLNEPGHAGANGTGQWTLIVVFNGRSGTGSAISIPGFTTAKRCKDATGAMKLRLYVVDAFCVLPE